MVSTPKTDPDGIVPGLRGNARVSFKWYDVIFLRLSCFHDVAESLNRPLRDQCDGVSVESYLSFNPGQLAL